MTCGIDHRHARILHCCGCGVGWQLLWNFHMLKRKKKKKGKRRNYCQETVRKQMIKEVENLYFSNIFTLYKSSGNRIYNHRERTLLNTQQLILGSINQMLVKCFFYQILEDLRAKSELHLHGFKTWERKSSKTLYECRSN